MRTHPPPEQPPSPGAASHHCMARVITDSRARHPAGKRLPVPRLLDWHCDAGHAPAQWCGDRVCPRCGEPGMPGRIPGGPNLLPVNREPPDAALLHVHRTRHTWDHEPRRCHPARRHRMSTPPEDRPGPDTTAAELRRVRAEIDAIRLQVIREQETREHRHDPPPPAPAVSPASPAPPASPVTLRARLAAWLAGEGVKHDHDAEVRASRRRWRTRQRDSASWRRHHGGSP